MIRTSRLGLARALAAVAAVSVAGLAPAHAAFKSAAIAGSPSGSMVDSGPTIVREPDDYWATHGVRHPSADDTVPYYTKSLGGTDKLDWSVGINNVFGNSVFGAGYGLSHVLRITPDGLSGDARATVFANLFGANKSIASFDYNLFGTPGKKEKTFVLKILGKPAYTESSLNDAGIFSEFTWTDDLFTAKKTFLVTAIPVTVAVAVQGELKLRGAAVVKEDRLVLNAQPKASVYGTASAAVDIGVASAGVRGKVNFVTLRPDFFFALADEASGGYSFYSTATLTLSTLDGMLDVFVRVGYGWLSTEYRKKILDWDGLVFTKVLYDDSQQDDGGETNSWGSPSARLEAFSR